MCGADVSRSSPSLASIPAKVVRASDSGRSPAGHIVVVAEGQPPGPLTDPDIQRLCTVPLFSPLLCATLSLADDSRPPQLDARHVLALCARYQDHLYQCAEAIAFDQNSLCVRIKEVVIIVRLYHSVTQLHCYIYTLLCTGPVNKSCTADHRGLPEDAFEQSSLSVVTVEEEASETGLRELEGKPVLCCCLLSDA